MKSSQPKSNQEVVRRSRRNFLEKIGHVTAAVSVSTTGAVVTPELVTSVVLAEEENSGPIDCGPPPKAVNATQTGGEGFAPLPLPVTPLRRSEKKRPPSPPSLIGKLALGTPRFIVKDGKQTMYRDWMTDPADVKTLLDWTNSKLGINYRGVESDLSAFSYDPRELPALLVAGHNKFELTDNVRENLARYVLDGGTIIADACCGWKDFTESFRHEMGLIFPQRPMRKMLPDNPVFASYYKLSQQFNYKKGDGTQYSAEPSLESIEIGCRDAVIFSTTDMTCGWDGHEHERGTRMTIDLARQVGANIVTYMLGTFQLGRFLSTSKIYHEESAPSRDDFVFAQIVHEGDWDPDPDAVHNLMKFIKENSTMEVKFKRQNVKMKDPTALTYPLWYMTGHRDFVWSEEEVTRLRQFVKAGGIFLADACCGRSSFDSSFRREIRRVFPDQILEPIPFDHPLYNNQFTITKVDYTPRTYEDFGQLERPELEAIMFEGKPGVIYSRFDLGNGWEQFPHAYAYGLKDRSALEIGTNILVYAVTH
ncbi:MAG: DUF4159 domain-containing protein [Planctomycetaceae bacterium]|jgi:hypothetical protein|nr:DUF4159 domain-containing protein [Planctomycetaceae bacterium]